MYSPESFFRCSRKTLEYQIEGTFISFLLAPLTSSPFEFNSWDFRNLCVNIVRKVEKKNDAWDM